MEFKRDMYLGMGALVLSLIIVCVGSVWLFARMSPAIGHVLDENDESLEAVEQILAVFAQAGPDSVNPSVVDQCNKQLERVRNNITESGEHAEIETIDRAWTRAMAGDASSRKQVVEALMRLASVNRHAMHEANQQAQRLGPSGAWAVTLLCVFGVASGLLVIRKVQQRILVPIDELTQVLNAVHAGDVYRRCTIAGAPQTLTTVMRSINAVLDRIHPSNSEHEKVVEGYRYLADDYPSVLIDDELRVLGVSQAVVAAMDEQAWRRIMQGLGCAMNGEVKSPIQSCESVADRIFLCRIEVDSHSETAS